MPDLIVSSDDPEGYAQWDAELEAVARRDVSPELAVELPELAVEIEPELAAPVDGPTPERSADDNEHPPELAVEIEELAVEIEELVVDAALEANIVEHDLRREDGSIAHDRSCNDRAHVGWAWRVQRTGSLVCGRCNPR
jgi:hypothetical protein